MMLRFLTDHFFACVLAGATAALVPFFIIIITAALTRDPTLVAVAADAWSAR